MTLATDRTATQTLSLLDELVLTLLNEESGYFRQVPGWDLNCAVVGAVLAELSLISRIDTDMDSASPEPPVATPNRTTLLDFISGMPPSVGSKRASAHASSHVRRAFPRTRTPHHPTPHEQSGLGVWGVFAAHNWIRS